MRLCVSVTLVVSDICRGSWNLANVSWYFCSFFHNENIFCLGKTFCLLSACCISMRSGLHSQNPWLKGPLWICTFRTPVPRREADGDPSSLTCRPSLLCEFQTSEKPWHFKKKMGATWRTAQHPRLTSALHMHNSPHTCVHTKEEIYFFSLIMHLKVTGNQKYLVPAIL